MSTRDLMQSYYYSLKNKNDKWQELYSEDANFADASQTLNAKGKTEVIKSFTPFLKGVESVKVKQMIIEDDYACAVVNYNYINHKGEKMNQYVAEVWEVKDEKLAKLTIYFDLTAYRNFMRG
ncbi:MAG: nuclear transport factor 2 family protein [Methanobacterium sp.]|jgi:ketosteroid isomerase-like protein